MASNKRDLKHYVRYDGSGRIIPGSNILSRKMPKVGKWVETDAYECCNGVSTIDGDWYLVDAHLWAATDGTITFPDHIAGIGEVDPNLVGTDTAISQVTMYINPNNSSGEEQYKINNLVGNAGTLTLTQGTDFITWRFTADTFYLSVFNANIAYDWNPWFAGNSIAGTLTVEDTSNTSFDTTNPISITINFD